MTTTLYTTPNKGEALSVARALRAAGQTCKVREHSSTYTAPGRGLSVSTTKYTVDALA